MKKLIESKYAILAILGLALGLRLILINQSLWLDESIGAFAVKNFNYKGLFEHFFVSDNHPPLYYLLLKLWTDLFGYTEFALRFPSVLFGVATVFFVYKIAKHVSTNHKSQITYYLPALSALLLTTSQLHIYYSQEARMYSMAAFLASLAIYSYLNLLKKEGYWWIIFSLTIATLLFSDYVPIFLIPVFWVVPILMRKYRVWWIKLVVAHIPLMVVGFLWLPTFLKQVQGGRWLLETLPAWKEVSGGATFKQAALVWAKFTFGRISLFNKLLYFLIILLASIPTVASLKKAWEKRNLAINVTWLWLVIPLILGFIASFWFPAFIYFRFLFVLPAFYLLVAYGILSFKNEKLRGLLAATLVLLNTVSFLIYIADERQQREKWRQAASFIEEKATSDEVVLFDNPEVITSYKWYSKGRVNAFGALDATAMDKDRTYQKTKRLISGYSGVYYFEYLADLFDSQFVVEEVLKDEGYALKAIYDFSGVGHIKYYRK